MTPPVVNVESDDINSPRSAMGLVSPTTSGNKPPLAPLPLPPSLRPIVPESFKSSKVSIPSSIATSIIPPGSPVSPAPLRALDEPIHTRHVRASSADNPNPRYRPTMEDAVTTHVFKDGSSFLGVYDGHGGNSAAQHAATSLHHHFATALSQTDDDDASIAFVNAYSQTDAELCTHRALNVGATAVTAYIDSTGRTLTIANAGDSRAVLGDINGDALRLSIDHRPTLPDEKQRLREAGAFVCGGRVNGCLAVSRALGDHCMKSAVICTPHVVTFPLAPMHQFLILGCDGLWDVVDDIQATKLVNALLNDRTTATKPTAGSLAQALVNLAIDAGTTDNVSVVVALLRHPNARQ